MENDRAVVDVSSTFWEFVEDVAEGKWPRHMEAFAGWVATGYRFAIRGDLVCAGPSADGPSMVVFDDVTALFYGVRGLIEAAPNTIGTRQRWAIGMCIQNINVELAQRELAGVSLTTHTAVSAACEALTGLRL